MNIIQQLALVENSYKHSDYWVFSIAPTDEITEDGAIFVCFGGVEKYPDRRTVIFKDCSIAKHLPEDPDEEYDGDVEDESYDIELMDRAYDSEFLLVTTYFQEEVMEMVLNGAGEEQKDER